MSMATPGEHKTVQARILAYAQEIGWSFVPRAGAEAWRAFLTDAARLRECELHIRNTFKVRELPEGSVVKDYLTTAADDKNTRQAFTSKK